METYKVEKGRILTRITGLEMMRQRIYKRLATQTNELIYTNYGTEDLIGIDATIFETECTRRITESLMKDDDIQSVSDFKYTYQGDSTTVVFTVLTTEGVVEGVVTVG